MGVQIEDGTGHGFQASVNGENRLDVQAVVADESHQINFDEMQMYSLVIEQTPTGGASRCFIVIKNTSASKLLTISSLTISCAAAETIQMKLRDVITTLAGGATLTAVTRNTNSANTPDATLYAGNAVTGLSGGSVVDEWVTTANQTSAKYHWDSDIMLGTSGVASFYTVTSGAAIKMTIAFYYHD